MPTLLAKERNPFAASYQLAKPVKTFGTSLQRHVPTAFTSAASPDAQGVPLGWLRRWDLALRAAAREMPDITRFLWCTRADD